MKQTCGSIREWLGAFADAELDPTRTEQVRAHLETCAGCRRELDQIEELHRLAKSVQPPRLVEDYWDWHRTKVWYGIRSRKRAPTPSYRPSFAWPRLAAAAAGFVIVLVVVIAGWRTLLERPGTVGRTLAERQIKAEAPVAAAPGAKRSAEAKETGKVAEGIPARVEGRSDGLAEVPAATGRDAEKTSIGYVSGGVGTTGANDASKPATASVRRSEEAELKVAAEQPGKDLASAPSAGAQHFRSSSAKPKGRIVSGPVLLDQPPLADADALDTGTVLLNVKTDSAGRVLSAGVRRSSGSPRLDSVAVRQIRQSRFKAATKNNRNVSSTFEYPFRVQKRQAKPQEQQKTEDKQQQREEHKVQEEQNQSAPDDESQKPKEGKQSAPTQDDKSQKQDSGNQTAPLKEETKK